jgi:hypothetical protein
VLGSPWGADIPNLSALRNPGGVAPAALPQALRMLSQAPSSEAATPSDNVNLSSEGTTRYVLVSTGAPGNAVGLSGMDAWNKFTAIKGTGSVTAAASESSGDDEYQGISRTAFWAGILMAAATLFALASYAVVSCASGDMPGVLYFPRMQTMVGMFAMSALSYEGAKLFR